MPSLELLIPFFVASAIFACVPGPGMIYAAAQTMALGRRGGWHSVVGFHLAGFVHIAAAAGGISVMLQVTPQLFVVMKLVGAAYLIVLGIAYLRSRPASAAKPHFTSKRSSGTPLRHSVVVEVLNPKSALFFLAFLPQFTDASAHLPVWLQIVILGVIVNAMFTITDVLVVEIVGLSRRSLESSERIALRLRRVGGGVLVALGVNLALARQ